MVQQWIPGNESWTQWQDAPRTAVRWRLHGGGAELQFREPGRSRLWRRRLLPPWALPFGTALLGGVLASTGWLLLLGMVGTIVAAAGLLLIDWWVLLLAGAIAVPAAGVLGFLLGRRSRLQAKEHLEARHRVTSVLGNVFGAELGTTSREQLARRVTDTMRSGLPGHVSVIGNDGRMREFVVEAVDAQSVRINPVVAAGNALESARRPAALSWRPSNDGITAGVDRQMADLQQRLNELIRLGNVDTNHPNYPAITLLRVDRLTEYRQLAERANTLAALGDEVSRRAAGRLAVDLGESVALVRRGVEEVEREILGHLQRESTANVDFLREKYDQQAPQQLHHG